MPVPPSLLFLSYAAVMGAALACFVAAFAVRRNTPVHRRVALAGAALHLGGTLVVLLVHRVLGWAMPARDPGLEEIHRAVAYVATAWVLVVALTGWRRHPWHRRIAPVLPPLYAVALGLAVAAYWPFGGA